MRSTCIVVVYNMGVDRCDREREREKEVNILCSNAAKRRCTPLLLIPLSFTTVNSTTPWTTSPPKYLLVSLKM